MKVDPGLPGAVVRTSDEVIVDGHNKPYHSFELTVTPEQFEQFRQGYRCIRCYALQESAFPESCIEPYCNFNLKRDQMKFLEFEDRGEVDLWPTRKSDIWTPGENT